MAEEILIRINLQSGEAKTKIDEVKKATEVLSKSIDKMTKSELANAIAQEKANIQRQITKKQVQELALAQINQANASDKSRAQSGLNNAILLETGRLASDASFGFTAIANNLSQLVSLFQSFAKTNGGFVKSLGTLIKSLMGSGGVLILLQLLISYGADLMKFFKGTSGAVDDFRKKFDEATKAIEAQEVELNNYIEVLGKANIPQKIRNNALKELEKVMPNIIDLDKENKLSIDDLRKATENYIEQATLRAKLEALLEANREVFLKNEKNRQIEEKLLATEDRDEREKILDEELSFFKNSKRSFTEFLSGRTLQFKKLNPLEQFRLLTKGTTDQFNQVVKDAAEIQEKLEEEITKRTGSGSKRRFREFQERLFDISKFKLKFDKEAAKLEKRTNQELLDIQEEFAKEEADRRLKAFVEKELKRLEEYKERVKNAKNANELIKNAEAEFDAEMQDAAIKHGEALISIENGFIAKRVLLKEKEALAVQKIERNIENISIDRFKNIGDADELFFIRKTEQIANDLENDKARLDAADTLKLSDVERAQLRQDIFTQENELIDLNLEKEIAAINQKKAINSQYADFAKGIGQLLSTLAGENEAMQKAALVVEKGAAIAKVVIDANASVLSSRAFAKAVPAIIPPGVPNPAKVIAEASSVRDIKATKIGAAIAIANILATTLTSFKSPSGSEGGGARSSTPRATITAEAPDFNVVGASQVSQLAQSVSGQVTKPVKAFVVGKEITSQQELDRNINNTAGI
jgi:hypothetical protein